MSLRAVRRAAAALAFAVGAATLIPSAPALAAGTITYLGQLAGPSIAATYPSGLEYDNVNNRIVVADTGLDRIEFWNETTGTQLPGTFGTHGSGNGQFDSPRDVAIDGSGNIYVADAGNDRIQSFTSSGIWRWTVGGIGACNTCLNTPIGVTWDAQNNVLLVASTGQDLVKAFDSSGAWKWQAPAATTTGINAPRDAARGPDIWNGIDGRLWIADYHNQEVKAFDVTGAGVFKDYPSGNTCTPAVCHPAITLGDGLAKGTGLGQLNFPYNIAFSLDGNTVYVADTGNNRVARWDISLTRSNPSIAPTPLAQISGSCPQSPDPCPDPPADLGYIDTLRRVVVDPTGNLITADFWGNGLQVWSSSGAPIREIALFAAPAPGFAQAYGVCTAPGGAVYGVDRLNQRIQGFDASGTYFATGGNRGTAPGRFSWPETCAVAPDGTVWVGDTRNDRIQHWPANLLDTPPIPSRGGSGSTVGLFNYIEGIAVAPDGRVWISDSANNRIQVYDPIANSFTAYGSLGAGNGQFSNPEGIAVSATRVYVADTLNNRVEVLSLTGQFIGQYTGAMSGPEGVTLAPDGTLWVTDTQHNQIVHVSTANDSFANLGDTFGSAGTGTMQFDLPHSLAIHGTTMYVADTYNNRISEFDISAVTGGGTFAPVYEKQVSDAGGVAPLYPAGGATDPSNGDRYIADSGGSRIVKITSGGVQTTVPTVFTWKDPRDIEFDATDPNSMWVADTSDSKIVEIARTGTIEHTYAGSPSKFKTPYGLSNDTSGVYVADTYNQRILKISKSTGATIWTASACGGKNFKRPRDAAVGSDGNIYVADTDNNRIAVLNPTTGACLRTFGAVGGGNGQFRAPRSLTNDGSGGLWVADAGNYRLQHVTNAGAFIGKAGGFGSGTNQYRSAHCVFRDGTSVDVCDTFNYRIQQYSVSAGVPSYSATIGGVQPTNSGFNGAFDAAYAPTGEIYAVDWFNHRIEKFDAAGNFLLQFGGYSAKSGSLIFPRGVVVTATGTVVVTDSENNRIDLFTSAGVFSKSIKPTTGTALNRPYQTALGSGGSYWVADTLNNRILHLDAAGAVLATWTSNGAGTFKAPRGVAVDSTGNVYVSDAGNNKVEEFNSAGTLLATLATAGSGPANVQSPFELRIVGTGSSAMLLIADSGNNRIVVLKLDGTPITTFGVVGAGNGQLNQPQGMDMSPVTGEIAVADFGNNRLSIWTTK